MAILGGGDSTRIVTDNKIAIESGSYNVTIVDEWVYYVTKSIDGTYPDGAPRFRTTYSRLPTDDREIKISCTLDDAPEIALEKRMPAYVSKNAALAKMIASLTGMGAGSSEMKAYDTKGLRGMKAVADIKFNGKEESPFSRIVEMRARPQTFRAAVRPLQPVDDRAPHRQDRPLSQIPTPRPIPHANAPITESSFDDLLSDSMEAPF